MKTLLLALMTILPMSVAAADCVPNDVNCVEKAAITAFHAVMKEHPACTGQGQYFYLSPKSTVGQDAIECYGAPATWSETFSWKRPPLWSVTSDEMKGDVSFKVVIVDCGGREPSPCPMLRFTYLGEDKLRDNENTLIFRHVMDLLQLDKKP